VKNNKTVLISGAGIIWSRPHGVIATASRAGSFAMPLDHGCWLDQHYGIEDLCPNSVKPHPEAAQPPESREA
jgi:hypothetical protein